MSDLFISDLHLSPERPAINRAFFAFLENRVGKADNLYILGDLVEVWIGDDDPSPFTRELIQRLTAVTSTGTQVYFQQGNRDFLVGGKFARETGITLLPEYHLLTTAEGKLLICHGDTLCTDDLDYQAFRRKVRHPLVRWLLAHLPLKKRQQIAQDWREKSRKANSNKADNIMDVNGNAVNAVMERFGASMLLHGHTHRPGVHLLEHGKRIVLGDWGKQGWYAEIGCEGIELLSFPISAEGTI